MLLTQHVRGANPGQTDRDGRNAVEWAFRNSDLPMLDTLLRLGVQAPKRLLRLPAGVGGDRCRAMLRDADVLRTERANAAAEEAADGAAKRVPAVLKRRIMVQTLLQPPLQTDISQRGVTVGGMLIACERGGGEGTAVDPFLYVSRSVVCLDRADRLKLLGQSEVETKHKCPCSGRGHDGGARRQQPYLPDGRLRVGEAAGRRAGGGVREIHECGLRCPCASAPWSCPMRTVQRGSTVPLQLVSTKARGWGVVPLRDVRQGELVLEMAGEVMSKESSQFAEEEYRKGAVRSSFATTVGTMVFDPTLAGSVARFANHSCEPVRACAKGGESGGMRERVSRGATAQNMVVRMVYGMLATPRMAMFAVRDIPMMQELTWDYLSGAPHQGDGPKCLCGAAACRGTM